MSAAGARTCRWSLLTAAVVLAVLFTCAAHDGLWAWLGVSHLRPYFADLIALLAASDARAQGLDPYAVPNYLDPFGRPHVYGPWWLGLWRLGLDRGDYVWLGLLLCASALGAAVAWLRPRTGGACMVAIALLISPSFLLAVERGNNDLVVFLLLVTAAALAARRERGFGLAATVVMVLAGALKLYPIAALVGLCWRRRLVTAVRLCAAGLCVFGVIWWISREELARAIALIPSVPSGHGFGIRVLQYLMSNPVCVQGLMWSGVALGLAGWVVVWRREWLRPLPLGSWGSGVAIGAAAWSFCFLVNFNYSYRAILLLLPAGHWLQIACRAEAGMHRTTARAALGGLLGMVWLTSLHLWMNSASVVWEFRVGSFLLGLQSGLAIGLTGYLMLVLVRIAWRAITMCRSRPRLLA